MLFYHFSHDTETQIIPVAAVPRGWVWPVEPSSVWELCACLQP